MGNGMKLVAPAVTPPLDQGFRPAVLANRAFLEEVDESDHGIPLGIALERNDAAVTVYETKVFAPDAPGAQANTEYVERLVKFLLWQRGGWKITIGGDAQIADHIKQAYGADGIRAFDADLMLGVYERPFTVESVAYEELPSASEGTVALGGHLEGCRIGFDLGASDRKTSAVLDGEAVSSEEVVWDPKNQADPQYHRDGVMDCIQRAAEHLPHVDAIGGSAAGIYINNRALVASLFRAIPKDQFDAKIKDMFISIGKEFGVPLVVVNDGEVTALAGAMGLEDTGVLGIAMGSSEAGGYVTLDGNITGWLNELAFCPIDYNPDGPVDEWSGDYGVGSQYFSQQCVARLVPVAGIDLDPEMGQPEQLEAVQELMVKGDERARQIMETIGCYLGYAVAHYADFYDLKHVLVLGRVTSGDAGHIIIERAQGVLAEEFPELGDHVSLQTPDEASRRVGQAIAAASLPEI